MKLSWRVSRKAAGLVLFASGLLVACGVVSVGPSPAPPQPAAVARQDTPVSTARTRNRYPTSPAPSAASTDPTSSPTGAADPPATDTNAVDCPDLATTPDARQVPSRVSYVREVPAETYKSFHWAPGHKQPPADDFFQPREKAIDQVFMIEQRTPGIVPKGFRDRLKGNPRDVTLRLAMAHCEVDNPLTARRASYDAVIAYFLGAPAHAAANLVLRSTHGTNKVVSCRNQPCADRSACDSVAKLCLNPQTRAADFVSTSELAIEDALTRALMREFYASGPATALSRGEVLDIGDSRAMAVATSPPDTLARVALFAWGVSRLHKCGGLACNFGRRDKDGQELFVQLDMRDQGYAGPMINEEERNPEIKRCRKETGRGNLGECLQNCRLAIREDDQPQCNAKCYAFCPKLH
jgi:hypothetical protein